MVFIWDCCHLTSLRIWYSKTTRLKQHFCGYFSHARSLSPIPVKTSRAKIFDFRVCTFEMYAWLGFGRVFSDLTENLEVFEPNFEVGKRNNSLSPTTFYTETLQCLLWKVVHFAATTDQDIAPSTVEKSKKMQHTVKKIVDHFAATTEDISPIQLWLDKSSN